VRYAEFRGLNLTLAVREGIIKHSHDYTAAEYPELSQYFLDQFPPLEAQLIDLADEIAYTTADFDDGFESGILTLAPARAGVRLFERFYAPMLVKYPATPEKLVFNEALKRMLNALVDDLIGETTRRVLSANATTLEAIRRAPARLVAFSPEMEELRMEAKQFLYTHLYNAPELRREHEEPDRIIRTLFQAWVAHPEQMPSPHPEEISEEGAPRVVADYIAGMTDQYILTQYETTIAHNG
jgi:dGTPase